MKKIILLLSILFILIGKINGQTSDTIRINDTIFNNAIFFKDVNKKIVFDVQSPFYVVGTKKYEDFADIALKLKKLIILYDKRDSVRAKSNDDLNNFYDQLFGEYVSMSKKVVETINFNNGKLEAVQSNLITANVVLGDVKSDIRNSIETIQRTKNDISIAKDLIKGAVKDLNEVKKWNKPIVAVLAGAGGVILGVLIGKL
jgi:hypothetical protein